MHQTLRMFVLVLFTAALGQAAAQNWPAKPVRLVVPTASGTPPDLTARMVAEKLSVKLGQSFVVDNVLGGGGLIGAQAVARAAPDGYTYYLGGIGIIVLDRHMYKSLPYDPDKDFAPVAVLYDSTTFGLAVHPELPARTVAELIALAKSQPGKLSYGSDSVGVTQITGQWFNYRAGTDMVGVPYKSPAQLMPDVAAGRTQLVFTSLPALEPYRRSGKLRLLAVTNDKRFPTLPDVPAIAETVPGFKVIGMGLLFAPTGTPADIGQRLNREIDPIVKEPEFVQKLLSFGFTTFGGAGSPQQIADFIRAERANWDTVLKGVKIEPQ